MNTEKKVCPLAVMDALIQLQPAAGIGVRGADEARAKVAELVASADALLGAVHAENPEALPFCYRSAAANLDAALAAFSEVQS